MRKVVIILFTFVLLAALALPALAVSGNVSLSASNTNLYRGDTFTVTAYLSSSDAIALGTVKLSYDTSALEMTGGSCHVSGASLAQVLPGSQLGTFMLSGEPAVVSGTLFTFQFRVRSGAAFGNYTISSSASIGVDVGQSISAGSTTVTVACAHTYGSNTGVDETNHQSTCSVCGDVQTAAHNWDNGTVLQDATCKDPGTKKLTCIDCGAVKEAPVPVNNNHKYGKWSETGSGHSRTCSVCGKQDSASHDWNSGTVIQAASCTATGTKKLTCIDCGTTKTATIPVQAHTYGTSTYLDATSHTHVCSVCNQASTTEHDYGTWIHDKSWHWLRCSGCGHEKDLAAHEPGPEATETTDQICTICEHILQPMGNHEHNFSQDWMSDDTGHWHVCPGCDERDSEAAHVYDNNCDADCNVCHMTRPVEHAADPQYQFSDESGHWRLCLTCGEVVAFEAHTPGPAATILAGQYCTVCQFEIAPLLPHDHVFQTANPSHTHYCICGEAYTADADDCPVCEEFPWQYVCIAEGVVICGLLLWLLLKKRRTY